MWINKTSTRFWINLLFIKIVINLFIARYTNWYDSEHSISYICHINTFLMLSTHRRWSRWDHLTFSVIVVGGCHMWANGFAGRVWPALGTYTNKGRTRPASAFITHSCIESCAAGSACAGRAAITWNQHMPPPPPSAHMQFKSLTHVDNYHLSANAYARRLLQRSLRSARVE